MGKLLLKRSVNETIVVNDELIISVATIHNNRKVTLSFDGPQSFSIVRGELITEPIRQSSPFNFTLMDQYPLGTRYRIVSCSNHKYVGKTFYKPNDNTYRIELQNSVVDIVMPEDDSFEAFRSGCVLGRLNLYLVKETRDDIKVQS